MRLITDIENDIQNKQTEYDQTTDEVQRSIITNAIADLNYEKKQVQEQQERVEIQEAEIQAITLPYDFNELFSEEGHIITNANEMIIEVVKDTKRQANIEKNQALDEQKADFEKRIGMVQDQLEYQHTYSGETYEKLLKLQEDYALLGDENLSKSELLDKANATTNQAVYERDDAFNKRDAAFRQLQEANEEIRILKIKLENVPTAAQSFDISPSDKLAQMVKESLADKVNRGLARWDIPVLETPAIPFVNEATRQDEATTDKAPNETDQVDANAVGEDQAEQGNQSVHAMVEQSDEESEVVSRAEFEALKAEVVELKATANRWAA